MREALEEGFIFIFRMGFLPKFPKTEPEANAYIAFGLQEIANIRREHLCTH